MTYFPDVTKPGGITLTSTQTIELGNADGNAVSRWIVRFTDEGSANFSTAIHKGIKGSSVTKVTSGVYYAETDPDTAATAAITTFGIFVIEAMGMDVSLVCTRTAGSMRVEATPVRG